MSLVLTFSFFCRMLSILSARDTSNFLLRCLLFGFFCLSAQHFELLNFACGFVASIARFNVGRL